MVTPSVRLLMRLCVGSEGSGRRQACLSQIAWFSAASLDRCGYLAAWPCAVLGRVVTWLRALEARRDHAVERFRQHGTLALHGCADRDGTAPARAARPRRILTRVTKRNGGQHRFGGQHSLGAAFALAPRPFQRFCSPYPGPSSMCPSLQSTRQQLARHALRWSHRQV